MSNDQAKFKIVGVLKIVDTGTGEVLVDKHNAIHPQNFALAIARAMSNEANGSVFKLCLGNGGTFLNSNSILTFRPPITTTSLAALYNQTYEMIVDDQVAGVKDTNSVIAIAGTEPVISSLILVTAFMSAAEPTDDSLITYTFDEIGLKTEDDLLLTHIIFEPIDKTTVRTFLITYTLDVSAA